MPSPVLVETSAIGALAGVGGDLETARGFVVLVGVHPVVEARPLGGAALELFVGEFAGVGPAPRLGGEAFQHARRMPGLGRSIRVLLPGKMRLVRKCDTGCEIPRELCGIGVSAAVGDMFEQPVIADAIQSKMGMAEMRIKRIVCQSERLANVVLGGPAHSLNPKRSERRTRDRVGCSHINRHRKAVANFYR